MHARWGEGGKLTIFYVESFTRIIVSYAMSCTIPSIAQGKSISTHLRSLSGLIAEALLKGLVALLDHSDYLVVLKTSLHAPGEGRGKQEASALRHWDQLFLHCVHPQ